MTYMKSVFKSFHTLFFSLQLLTIVSLTGCVVLPIEHDNLTETSLQAINKAYIQTVKDTLNDPNEHWTSGWLGNMWVNYHEGKQRGLCYQWKYRVHAGVKTTVLENNWGISGIVVNEGAKHEHHAVIVYDPVRIKKKDLLTATRHQPVYILDPWRQGQPDIYHVSDWLKLPAKTTVPARLITAQ